MRYQSVEVLPGFKQHILQRVLGIPKEPIENVARLFLCAFLDPTIQAEFVGTVGFNSSDNDWSAVYAALATSASTGAVRDLGALRRGEPSPAPR